MNEKPLGKEMCIKYLKFLIESANKLLTTGLLDYEFENLMKEYAKFLYRVLKSPLLDDNFKHDLAVLGLYKEEDLVAFDSPMIEGFLSRMPFYNQILKLNDQIKINKIKELQERLSSILFKIEGYTFDQNAI